MIFFFSIAFYWSERLLKNLRSHKVNELYLTVREVKLANPGESANDIEPWLKLWNGLTYWELLERLQSTLYWSLAFFSFLNRPYAEISS